MGQEISKSSKLIETNFVAKTYFDISKREELSEFVVRKKASMPDAFV